MSRAYGIRNAKGAGCSKVDGAAGPLQDSARRHPGERGWLAQQDFSNSADDAHTG